MHLLSPSILLAVGSFLFLIAAFLPVSKVYVERKAEIKIQFIEENLAQWKWSHVLFIIGSLATVFALIFVVLEFDKADFRWMVYAGAGSSVVGTVLWVWHCTERLTNYKGFASGQSTKYLFAIYSFFMQSALVFFGLYLLNVDIAEWIAWMLIVGGALIFFINVITRDMPPFVYYLITAIMAIALLV